MMRKLEALYKRLPKFFRNKFTLTFLGFLVWMFFFDAHHIFSRAKSMRELREARQQVAYYKQQIAQTEKDLSLLFSSNESIERFARERFYLKRDDEEVYLLAEEE